MRSWWVETCASCVVALETGGRWSGEAVEFIDMMAGPNHAKVSPLGVATSVDAQAECVFCPGFRELPGGSWSGRVEWH